MCVYVTNELKSTRIDTGITKHEGVDEICVQVQCRKLPSILICCIYRHPKASVTSFDYIEDTLRALIMRKKTFFLLGDLNDNLFHPNSKLSHVISHNKLSQLIDKPTRVTPTSATLLDIIITNKPDMVLQSSVTPTIIADHDLISVSVDILKPKRQPTTTTKRDLRNYTSDTLSSLIINETSTLNQILQTDDVDKQVSLLTSVISNSIDKCAPMSTVTVHRPPAPWLNDEIKEAIKERNKAQTILKSHRLNPTLQIKFKDIKRRVKNLITSTKKKYYQQELENSKNNIAATWKTLKNIIPSKRQNKTTPPLETLNDKVDDFNKFFASVGLRTYESTQESLRADSPNPSTEGSPTPSLPTHTDLRLFRPQPVDQVTVILTVKQLQKTNSFGSDNISLKFIKDSLIAIIFYLTTIINTSIVTGTFPAPWKNAIVIPLHKSGDHDDIGNYRPISLLPILSKILEKIIANQLVSFLESNKLLSPTQHGFRPKLSTVTALQVITDKIYENIDKKQISLLTLCDLSKAFDSVNHTILLQKLHLVNVDAFWFSSYLNNRTQSVRINNTVSSRQAVPYGVPQGSILGPLLFNIYVNDMPKHITNCILVQYADDTQFLHSGNINNISSIISKTENTLKQVRKYFLENGLKLNTNKTQCLFLGTRQLLAHIPHNTTIRCAGSDIQPSTHAKNLGIYLDSYLTFEKHTSEIIKKAMGTLMFVNRNKDYFTKDTRITILQTLVLSALNYGITVWGTTNSTILNKVQKIQNFTIKVADGKARKFDHVTPLFKELKWLRVKELVTFNLIITVFKYKIKEYPDHILPLQTVNNVTNSTTRQQNNLYVRRTNTDTGARAISVLGPKLWNSLPPEVKDSVSLSTLKSKLRKYLLASI